MNEDDDFWHSYARTVKPLTAVKNKPALPRSEKKKTVLKPVSEAPKIINSATKPSAHRFNRSTERDLRSGDVEIDARIDLHGLQENPAYEALMQFVGRNIKNGSRRLLIITGKGSGGAGLLKTSLPYWLNHSPYAAQILDLRPAANKHGGAGAFYVTLRKPKT
jgi:DNA-nicking Smr family endonuclease